MTIGIDARMYRQSTAGIGRYTRNLIENLLKIDQNNQYVLFMTSEDYREFKNPNSKTQISNKSSNVKIQITNIAHYSLAEQTKIARIIEKEKLDLMHFTNFNHPMNFRGKFIVTIHDLTLFHYPATAKKTNFIKRLGFRLVMKNAVQKSAKIIAVSEFTKKDILKFSKVDPAKITVIHEAADDKIEKIRNPQRIQSEIRNKYNVIDESIVLYVGQYRPHKNIDGLLKAFVILKKDFPAKLVLLGKMPAEFKVDNKEILSDLPAGRQVLLMPGFVSDEELAAWYKLADVFVFPSFYEGFGLPGLEAMMAGLPVASSRAGSLPEIFQDAALYFNPHSPQDMADKIGKILQDDKIRTELIKKGLAVAKKYSWEKCASETLDLYKQTLKN